MALQTKAAALSQVGMPPAVATLVTGVATATQAGMVTKGAAVTNCTVAADGTSAGTQLNALLVSLRAAGVIA
jgi:hypothetical protein